MKPAARRDTGRCGAKCRRLAVGMAGLAFGWSSACPAQEIAPFRLTGYEGYVSLNYLSDSQSQGFAGGPATTYALSNLQEEVFLNTHSYFYHPNFLKMDLGGGPLLVQNRAESEARVESDHETLYNLAARLSFLEQKPFPFAFYYERLNPTVTTSLTQSFVQTNTKYGATFSVREPLSPVLVSADVFRLVSEGRSPTLIVDDRIDQASLRLSTALGRDGYGQLAYQVNRQDSQSGVPALAILPTTIENRTASLDSRVLFGSNRELALSNYLSYYTLAFERPDFSLVREDFHFTPDLRWRHSDTLTSFYNYNLYRSNETAVDATNQSARAGLTYRDGERLSLSADVHGEDNRITGLDLRSYGIGALASAMQPWTNATLRLSAGAVYDWKDRDAATALVNVVGERITLVDGIPVTLAQEFIDTATIRVFNLGRTQEYSPVTDYRIIVIGTRTQVQRLATGNILDGQEVLVDYAFQTGGSITYNSLNQNYQASLTLYRYYTVYVRHLNIDFNLTSGLPLLPLNPLRNTLYGLRIDQPLWPDFLAGGEATFERQDEEIAPYRRASYDVYLQLPPLYRVSTRLSGRRIVADYFYSLEDVDLTGWALQLRAIPWDYTTLTAEVAYEEDTGGTLARAIARDTLGIEWRLRQLSVRGEGQYTREEQGGYERDRTVIRVVVRREFR